MCIGRSKLMSRELDARLDRLLTGTCEIFFGLAEVTRES